MTKKKAIEWIKDIQGGNGINRDKHAVLLNMRGEIAERLWDTDRFTYGFEYGVMYTLIDVFDITERDLLTELIKGVTDAIEVVQEKDAE